VARDFGLLGTNTRFKVLWLDGTYKQPETHPYQNDFWASNTLEPTDTAVQNSYVGTGNGTLEYIARAVQGAPSETWTLTATSATTFSVSGSISGAQAVATVGTVYDNGICRFLLEAGGVAFVVSDEFIFQTGKAYTLEKIVLLDTNQNYGELEGVSFITGFANAAENTVVDENSDTHIVLRNIQSTGFLDYFTIILD
jgi:hypothetical protein